MGYSIGGAALLLLIGNAASRILGLVREAVIFALFGRSAEVSAFATAATVPTMVFDLLVGGAISAALIPVLSDHADSPREFGRVAGALLTLTLAAAVVLVVVLEILAPMVVLALGAAGTLDAEATTSMVRLMLPSVVLLGAGGVVQAMLQARGTFRYTAASTSGFNLGIILAAFGLAWFLGPTALALGVVLGAGLQLSVQAWGARGIPLQLVPDWRHPAVRRALRLYLPVAAGLLVSQVAIAVDRFLANQTGEQVVATMRAATTLVQLPLGLIATATSFAVLPVLARALQDDRSFVGTLASGVRLALLAMIPATVGLVLLREPVVQLLFQRGAFGPQDTAVTAAAFLWYSPQMPFWAVDQLLIFAFYARKDTLTPVLVGVVCTLIYLAVALSTVATLGMFGLILANTVQNSSHALIMYLLLARAGLGLGGLGVEALLGRTAVASGAAALVFLASRALFGPAPPDALGNAVWLVLVAAGMALATVATLAALRTPELVTLTGLARRRFGRSPP